MRRFLALVALAGVTGVAAPAYADPGGADASFLAALGKAGISFRSEAEAVAAGREACRRIDGGEPEIDVVKGVTELNPGFPISGAATFTAIAMSAYCPQHLRSGDDNGAR
jgi:hypothetical protein